jgi:hypothetical protein
VTNTSVPLFILTVDINIPIHEKEEVERALTDLFERLEYEITTLMPEITAILQKHSLGSAVFFFFK